jgi:hypothetical protein
MYQPRLNLSALSNNKPSSILKGEMVVTVTHLKQDLAGFHKAEHNHGLEEDRYWGISSALERLDGRLAREEYYSRMDMWEAKPIDGVAEGRSGKKESGEPLDVWSEEVERVRSESMSAYEYFLDSLFFYYGENARAVEMGTSEG